MRAPNPSFESELAAVLREKSTPKQRNVGRRTVIAAGPTNDRQHLARWLSDERAEKIWRKVNARAPVLAPRDFIKVVLNARRSAVASVDRVFGDKSIRLESFLAEWAATLKRLKKRVRHAPSNIAPVEFASILEESAFEARALHSERLNYRDQVSFPLSRKGPNENRSRKAFEQIMSDYFQEHCGAKLLSEIGDLTEIAFPGKLIDRDDVRSLLRRRRRKPRGR